MLLKHRRKVLICQLHLLAMMKVCASRLETLAKSCTLWPLKLLCLTLTVPSSKWLLARSENFASTQDPTLMDYQFDFAGNITLNLKAHYLLLYAITIYSSVSKTRFNEKVFKIKSRNFNIHSAYNFDTLHSNTIDIETIVSKPVQKDEYLFSWRNRNCLDCFHPQLSTTGISPLLCWASGIFYLALSCNEMNQYLRDENITVRVQY